MRTRRTAIAVALCAAAVLGACSGGAEEGGDGPTTTSTTTSTPSTPTSTPGTEGGTSAPSGDGPSRGFGSARLAIDHFVAAWMADDQATARTGATAEAVRNVFTQPGAGYALYRCDTGEFDTSTCNLRNRATHGYASITAEKAPIGWIVTAVYMTIDD